LNCPTTAVITKQQINVNWWLSSESVNQQIEKIADIQYP